MHLPRKTASRKTITIWLLIMLGVVGVGMLLFLSRPKEPRYQGRSLSEWLDESDETKAQEAVTHIGTNAIPFLLKSLFNEDSQFKKKLIEIANKQTFINFNLYSEETKQYAAMAGFQLLGTNANSAIPALSNELFYGKFTSEAALTLGLIPTNAAIHTLIAGLQSSNKTIRFHSAFSLGTAVFKAKEAVPHLILALKDQDQLVRLGCARALGQINSEPEKVIPALIDALNDAEPSVRWNAAESLGRFGEMAKTAVPKLLELTKQDHPYVRERAVEALAKIDPIVGRTVQLSSTNAISP